MSTHLTLKKFGSFTDCAPLVCKASRTAGSPQRLASPCYCFTTARCGPPQGASRSESHLAACLTLIG